MTLIATGRSHLLDTKTLGEYVSSKIVVVQADRELATNSMEAMP